MTPTAKVTALLLRATLLLTTGWHSLRERHEHEDGDRGDVPGWVMITLMTSIIVIALLAIFRTEIIDAVSNAFSNVQNG